ncbi:sterol-binding-like protein [Cladochytrium replicatum]|nr:sterol-binding-like protein [Cladochytrium replicatum]
MSVNIPGFKSSAVFDQINTAIKALPAAQKEDLAKKVNGVFELVVKNTEGTEQTWVLNFKAGTAEVSVGKPSGKSDITISIADETFVELASGKLTGQKAFMSGKLKVKGNMMLATKLDSVFKTVTLPSSKL